MTALEGFDASRGLAFSTFAVPRIPASFLGLPQRPRGALRQLLDMNRESSFKTR